MVEISSSAKEGSWGRISREAAVRAARREGGGIADGDGEGLAEEGLGPARPVKI